MFNVPYMAMPGEMSDSYHERTAIMSFRVVFIQFGYLIGVGLAPQLAKAMGGGLKGYGSVGWILGLGAGLAMLASFFGTARARSTEKETVKYGVGEQLRSVLVQQAIPAAVGIQAADSLFGRHGDGNPSLLREERAASRPGHHAPGTASAMPARRWSRCRCSGSSFRRASASTGR